MPITSIIKNEPYSILINQKDLTNGNIDLSRIRADKISNVENNNKKIELLNDDTFKKVQKEITNIIK